MRLGEEKEEGEIAELVVLIRKVVVKIHIVAVIIMLYRN
jgi:hypothetical protein